MIVTSGCSHVVVGWLCNGFSFYRSDRFTKGVRAALCEIRNSCSCEQLNFFSLNLQQPVGLLLPCGEVRDVKLSSTITLSFPLKYQILFISLTLLAVKRDDQMFLLWLVGNLAQ